PPVDLEETADIAAAPRASNAPEPAVAHSQGATASKEPQQNIATALLDELNRIILPREPLNEHS
ncbi:MAG: hypothetical protein LOY00_09750, partial [Methylocaldum sp.]|nr:hypothetical protein [Methylocaldum sp.]